MGGRRRKEGVIGRGRGGRSSRRPLYLAIRKGMAMGADESHQWGGQYGDFRNSRREWASLDGAWRETRGPTEDEVEEIDGETQTLGFGERSCETYEEVLTNNPKYTEYLMGEGRRRHLEMKKFIEWLRRGNISIVAKEEKGGACERWGLRREGLSL